MIALILAHVVGMVIYFKVVQFPWLILELFDLDEEDSFGTWFSGANLLFTGCLLLLYAKSLQESKENWLAWFILGIGFCFLSMDEIVGLHESYNSVTEFSWAIPGGILAIVIGTIYIPFLVRLPRRTLTLFCLGGAFYVGGAVGVELATEPYARNDMLMTLEYNLTTAIEEGFEMIGVVIFQSGLLKHIVGEQGDSVAIDVKVEP